MRPGIAVAALVAAAIATPDEGRAATRGGARWTATRPLLVADATGDARLRRALLDFAARWNAFAAEARLDGAALPTVVVRAADAGLGCAAPPYEEVERHGANVLVCRDDGLPTAGVGGPYWVDDEGGIRFGLVKLRGATLRWSSCNLATAVSHEMGHVMGLGHRDDAGASVMRPGKAPYGLGCGTWFDGRDRDHLRTLYPAEAGRSRRQTADGSGPGTVLVAEDQKSAGTQVER